MVFWIITSIRLAPADSMLASTIQNIQTAISLAQRGHQVLLWVQRLEGDWKDWLEKELGRSIPEKLHFFPCSVGGPEGEKKSPFHSIPRRIANISRALILAPPPDVIISRSPRILDQLRHTHLISTRRKRILEYQYPEWAQLWRKWRQRNPAASLSEAKRYLGELKEMERERLSSCSGVLYAAADHERLLSIARYAGPRDLLPSGCMEPDEDPPILSPSYDIGYVGSLRPENGVHVLLQAVKMLPAVKVMIAGDGPAEYVRELKQIVERLSPLHSVDFLGHIPVNMIRKTMRLCHIGTVPISSRFGPEKRQYASPLKLVEWFAAGVSVVASSVPSVVHNVDPASQVLLVPPDSPQALSSALASLLQNPLDRERLKRNAILVSQQCSFSNRAARIEAFARRPM